MSKLEPCYLAAVYQNRIDYRWYRRIKQNAEFTLHNGKIILWKVRPHVMRDKEDLKFRTMLATLTLLSAFVVGFLSVVFQYANEILTGFKLCLKSIGF